MRVQTYFSPAEVNSGSMAGATAVVIDVIRATTTIADALANGAKAIYPTVSTEDAIRLANSLGREDTLLCGERKGMKVEGFDLGNSPAEFTEEKIAGKQLVMSTTNGTRAFLAAEGASRIIAGSLLNLSAVAEDVSGVEQLVLICAGKEDRFSLDDALCAGLIVRALSERTGSVESEMQLDDASRAVLALARSCEPDEALLRETAAGSALVEIGLEADLSRCAELDRHALIPEMHDRMIRISGGG